MPPYLCMALLDAIAKRYLNIDALTTGDTMNTRVEVSLVDLTLALREAFEAGRDFR